MIPFFGGLAVLAAYLAFVAVRVGLLQRSALALRSISLDTIPERAARMYGDKPLFTCDTPVRWDVPAFTGRYRDATDWSARRIASTAAYLAAMLTQVVGVKRTDRVAIFKENHFDIHLLHLSVVRAGGIACTINGKFAANDLEPYLKNLGATVLISDGVTLRRVLSAGATFGGVRTIVVAEKKSDGAQPDWLDLLAAVSSNIKVIWIEEALRTVGQGSSPIPRGKDEPLYLVHSSGTTGFPKAVILKNGAQSHAVRGWLCYVHVSRTRDKGYMAVPNNHQAVILTFHGLLLLGVPVHWACAYDRDGFDAELVVRELAAGSFTGYFGFPITYTQLARVDFGAHDLSRMRVWASTADASHEVIQRHIVAVGSAFRDLGVPVSGSVYLDAQGSSEVGTPSVLRYITRFTKHFQRRIGRPGSTPFGPKIRIVGDNGRVVARGEAGRLEVKGKTVFAGYWNNHSLTLAAISDGWFFTGDIARQERDGHLVQLDREVDVIRTAAGPVYSLLIEEKIHKHSAVFDACVYGARQPDGSQLPAAAIALRDASVRRLNAAELKDELNATLTAEEQLQRVEIMDWNEFPIGITGKTLKRVFRLRTEGCSAQSG
jgi:acyl-coenzyme A synthetase/AMP-(fatty) acid ligase